MAILQIMIAAIMVYLGDYFFVQCPRKRKQPSMRRRLILWCFIVTPLTTWFSPWLVRQSFFGGIFLAKVMVGLAGVVLALGLISGFLYLVFGRVSWEELKKKWRDNIESQAHFEEMP